MSNIIDPNESLIQPPIDPEFWQKPVSRRAFQAELHKIGKHLADLWAAVDTSNILVNYIMEKKLIKEGQTPADIRAEVEEFVKEKQAQLKAMRENAIGQVGQNEQSGR